MPTEFVGDFAFGDKKLAGLGISSLLSIVLNFYTSFPQELEDFCTSFPQDVRKFYLSFPQVFHRIGADEQPFEGVGQAELRCLRGSNLARQNLLALTRPDSPGQEVRRFLEV